MSMDRWLILRCLVFRLRYLGSEGRDPVELLVALFVISREF